MPSVGCEEGSRLPPTPGDGVLVVWSLSRVQLFATPWTVSRQAPQFSSVAQSCPTLCHPMDGKPPSSYIHVISQARILEWVAISYTRGSSQSRV